MYTVYPIHSTRHDYYHYSMATLLYRPKASTTQSVGWEGVLLSHPTQDSLPLYTTTQTASSEVVEANNAVAPEHVGN